MSQLADYRRHYSRFISADPERLHFAAHSHHYWPDVTRDAQIAYWDDSAQLADAKWEKIFGETIPEAQRNIAKLLNLSAPEQIAFAPSTHEFVSRILSCFDLKATLKILTTDSEFYSFDRQIRRYQELPQVEVTRVPVLPFETFTERLCTAAAQTSFDLIYVSHVFFNTSFFFHNPTELLSAVKSPDTIIVIDGYHSFMALPVDLKSLQHRIFFTAGGYKYAQSGEGVCFLWVPPGFNRRPLNTGWFASFGNLTQQKNTAEVPFANDGFRFWGATFDPSGLYRFNAVCRWLESCKLSVTDIDRHVKGLQRHFLQKLEQELPALRQQLLFHSFERHGHFFSFRTPRASELCAELRAHKVVTDYRGDILRFGFGLYQTMEDIDRLFGRMKVISSD